MGLPWPMKAAGINVGIGLVSTHVSVAVGYWPVVVLAFDDATIAILHLRGSALGRARRERRRESESNGRDEPRVRESDRLNLDDGATGQRDHRDPGRGDERRRVGTGRPCRLRRAPALRGDGAGPDAADTRYLAARTS